MKAFKCDRWGKIYTHNEPKWDDPLIFRISWDYERTDLCDDCYAQLQIWMSNKEGDKEYEYRTEVLPNIGESGVIYGIKRLNGKGTEDYVWRTDLNTYEIIGTSEDTAVPDCTDYIMWRIKLDCAKLLKS